MSDFKSMFNDAPAEADAGFSLLPEGDYSADLTDCKLDLTKAPAAITFIYTINDANFGGRKLFGNYRLEGRGLGFLKKDLKQLGIDYSNVSAPEDIARLVWDRLVIRCDIHVIQKEYNGKIYNNVYLNGASVHQKLSPANAPTPATRQATRPAVKNHAPQAAAGSNDSDIPW